MNQLRITRSNPSTIMQRPQHTTRRNRFNRRKQRVKTPAQALSSSKLTSVRNASSNAALHEKYQEARSYAQPIPPSLNDIENCNCGNGIDKCIWKLNEELGLGLILHGYHHTIIEDGKGRCHYNPKRIVLHSVAQLLYQKKDGNGGIARGIHEYIDLFGQQLEHYETKIRDIIEYHPLGIMVRRYFRSSNVGTCNDHIPGRQEDTIDQQNYERNRDHLERELYIYGEGQSYTLPQMANAMKLLNSHTTTQVMNVQSASNHAAHRSTAYRTLNERSKMHPM